MLCCCRKRDDSAGKEGTQTNELQVRRIPRHVWPHLAVMLFSQLLIFYPTRLLLPYLPKHSLETALDAAIPLRAEWIVIYYLTFVFWIVSAVLILSIKRESIYIIRNIIYLICFYAFIAINREKITNFGIATYLYSETLLSKIENWIYFIICLFDFGKALFSPKRITFHDKIAGTVVVYKPV